LVCHSSTFPFLSVTVTLSSYSHLCLDVPSGRCDQNCWSAVQLVTCSFLSTVCWRCVELFRRFRYAVRDCTIVQDNHSIKYTAQNATELLECCVLFCIRDPHLNRYQSEVAFWNVPNRALWFTVRMTFEPCACLAFCFILSITLTWDFVFSSLNSQITVKMLLYFTNKQTNELH